MRNPVCPHCKREITYWQSLKISNPFFFKCPLCKLRLKQFAIALVLQALIILFWFTMNTIRIFHEIEARSTMGIAVSAIIFIAAYFFFEWMTHRYLSKYGILSEKRS